MSTVEQNKGVVRRFLEEFAGHGDATFEQELLSPDYRNLGFGASMGLAEATEVKRMFNRAFPDLHVTVHDLVADGETVVARLTFGGTHRGEFQGIPATGRAFRVEGMAWYRVAGGKIVEDWPLLDNLGLLQQLGVIPAPEAPVA